MEQSPPTAPLAPDLPEIGAPDPARLGPRLWPWVTLLNTAGLALRRLGIGPADLSPESLMARAERLAGLLDWGDDRSFRQPLRMLTQPDQDLAALTPVGRLLLRHVLVERLVSRLRIQDYVAGHPEVRDSTIARPLIVLGLPRTGTTFLHGLLSQDPACRPMLAWYAHCPAPPPRPGSLEAAARIARCDREIRNIALLARGLQAIHHTAAAEPEECMPLLMNTFMTDAYGLFADFESYRLWLGSQDMTPAYRYYRLQLQILQQHVPGAHWVLKTPAHLPNLGTLLTVFPDACIVWTHRDPGNSVPSMLNLRFKALGLGNRLRPDAAPCLIRRSLESLRDMLARAEAARRAVAPGRILDVQYDELIRDPVSVVRQVYDHFGFAWADGFQDGLKTRLRTHAAGRHGRHAYDPAAFGLRREDIRRAFGVYCAAYGIPPESPGDSSAKPVGADANK